MTSASREGALLFLEGVLIGNVERIADTKEMSSSF